MVQGLGVAWEIHQIIVKPYATMTAMHSTIDCIVALQSKYPRELTGDSTRQITVEMLEPCFKKGGWQPKRPLTVTGAQMSCIYAAAMQILEGEAQPERDDMWALMAKIKCVHNPEFDADMDIIW